MYPIDDVLMLEVQEHRTMRAGKHQEIEIMAIAKRLESACLFP
jgi:hypothetical protein